MCIRDRFFKAVPVKASPALTVIEKLDGVCYGPSRDGEDPTDGILPSEQALQEDIRLISKLARSVRTYGTTGSLEKIPQFCQEAGLDCYPGAWISKNREQNQKEIQSLIRLAGKGFSSTKALVVGNEMLLRQDLSEDELIAYIRKVKQETKLSVATAEPWDTWLEHPKLAQAVDLILVHIYPYWDGIPVNSAAEYVFSRWQDVKRAFPDKKVTIGETGWPSQGDKRGGSVPSEENQGQFLTQFLELNRVHNAEYFWFEVFDEKWKEKFEGSVGSHWGLYYSKGFAKPLPGELFSQEARGDGKTWPVICLCHSFLITKMRDFHCLGKLAD